MIPVPPLLLITDRRQARHPLADVARAAAAGGVRWISLREKDLPASAQLDLLAALKAALGTWTGSLLLHGDPALALAGHCDGVHLPAEADAQAARAMLGAKALIGQSIHGPAEAEAADPAALDYVVAGPVFETVSKTGYGPALGAAGLAHLARSCRVPLLALGGVEPSNASLCRRAGAAGMAAMGGPMRAVDPEQTVRALLAGWSAPLTTD